MPNGIAGMPMTEAAAQAFEPQMKDSADSEYVFPSTSPKATKPYLTTVKAWAGTLRRARIQCFSLYELRHTFATRLSAGGVADHFVTQMLRQGDAADFKRYSQAKLKMMREALPKLDRQANEHSKSFGTVSPKEPTIGTILAQSVGVTPSIETNWN
jgi:integrase